MNWSIFKFGKAITKNLKAGSLAPLAVRQDEQAVVFDWIEDEKLLKDEAVLTALAGTDPELRLETIRTYFKASEEVLVQHINNTTERKEQAQLRVSEVSSKVQQVEDKLAKPTATVQAGRQLYVRHLLGVNLYCVMAGCIGVLIEHRLGSHFQNSWLVTPGLLLFGMFSMFAAKSVFFTSTKEATENGRESWKVWLEEAVIPVVVAGYVVLNGEEQEPVYHTIILGLLLTLAFVFVGKGLLSKISGLREDWKVISQEWRQKRERKIELMQLRKEHLLLKKERDELVADLEKISEQLLSFRGRLKRAEARCHTIIALFKSEFEWGCNAKSELSDRQVSNLKSLGIAPAKATA